MGFNKHHVIAPYDESSLQVTYPTQKGILQIPVADTDAPAEIVYTHGPVSQKVVAFAEQRTGRWPTIPKPVVASSNEVLADVIMSPFPPALDADGISYTFRVQGQYVFALATPIGDSDKLSCGIHAYDDAVPRDVGFFDPKTNTADLFNGRTTYPDDPYLNIFISP